MLICMRTTLNLNDDLVQQAKQRAVNENSTLTSVIEDALRRLLSGSRALEHRPSYQVRLLPPSDLQPGLDLNDPAFYKQIVEQDDYEKYGPQSRSRSRNTDAAL